MAKMISTAFMSHRFSPVPRGRCGWVKRPTIPRADERAPNAGGVSCSVTAPPDPDPPDSAEPGVDWPPEARGRWPSLSPPVQLLSPNQDLSRPSGGPAEVRRGRPSPSLPEGVQHRDRVGWRRIHIEAERTEGISAVHDDISQTHRLGESGRTEASLARIAESISQLRDRRVSEALRRLAHGSVWFQPSSQDVAHHRPKRPLGTSHKVSEHIAHLPPRAPRG